MIQSRGALRSVRNNWAGVRASQDLLHRGAAFVFASGGFVPTGLVDTAHATVLLFACSVLEAALQQLRRERVFTAGSRHLGALIDGSRGVLPWSNLAAIESAVALRNQVAHKRVIPPRADTRRAIEAIEAELVLLRILSVRRTEPRP